METRYTLMEAPAAMLIGRRGFFKVVGLVVACAALASFAISDLIAKRNKILLARQDGLYRDDLRLQKMNLASAHQNPSVKKAYEDMNGKPCEGLMYDLVHTTYSARANLDLEEKSREA